MTEFAKKPETASQTGARLDLGHQICRRYGNSPGLAWLPGAPRVATRISRFTSGQLPLLAQLQRRWSSSSGTPRGWNPSIYVWPFFREARAGAQRILAIASPPSAQTIVRAVVIQPGNATSAPRQMSRAEANARSSAAADSRPPATAANAAQPGTIHMGRPVYQRQIRRGGLRGAATDTASSGSMLPRPARQGNESRAAPGSGATPQISGRTGSQAVPPVHVDPARVPGEESSEITRTAVSGGTVSPVLAQALPVRREATLLNASAPEPVPPMGASPQSESRQPAGHDSPSGTGKLETAPSNELQPEAEVGRNSAPPLPALESNSGADDQLSARAAMVQLGTTLISASEPGAPEASFQPPGHEQRMPQILACHTGNTANPSKTEVCHIPNDQIAIAEGAPAQNSALDQSALGEHTVAQTPSVPAASSVSPADMFSGNTALTTGYMQYLEMRAVPPESPPQVHGERHPLASETTESRASISTYKSTEPLNVEDGGSPIQARGTTFAAGSRYPATGANLTVTASGSTNEPATAGHVSRSSVMVTQAGSPKPATAPPTPLIHLRTDPDALITSKSDPDDSMRRNIALKRVDISNGNPRDLATPNLAAAEPDPRSPSRANAESGARTLAAASSETYATPPEVPQRTDLTTPAIRSIQPPATVSTSTANTAASMDSSFEISRYTETGLLPAQIHVGSELSSSVTDSNQPPGPVDTGPATMPAGVDSLFRVSPETDAASLPPQIHLQTELPSPISRRTQPSELASTGTVRQPTRADSPVPALPYTETNSWPPQILVHSQLPGSVSGSTQPPTPVSISPVTQPTRADSPVSISPGTEADSLPQIFVHSQPPSSVSVSTQPPTPVSTSTVTQPARADSPVSVSPYMESHSLTPQIFAQDQLASSVSGSTQPPTPVSSSTVTQPARADSPVSVPPYMERDSLAPQTFVHSQLPSSVSGSTQIATSVSISTDPQSVSVRSFVQKSRNTAGDLLPPETHNRAEACTETTASVLSHTMVPTAPVMRSVSADSSAPTLPGTETLSLPQLHLRAESPVSADESTEAPSPVLTDVVTIPPPPARLHLQMGPQTPANDKSEPGAAVSSGTDVRSLSISNRGVPPAFEHGNSVLDESERRIPESGGTESPVPAITATVGVAEMSFPAGTHREIDLNNTLHVSADLALSTSTPLDTGTQIQFRTDALAPATGTTSESHSTALTHLAGTALDRNRTRPSASSFFDTEPTPLPPQVLLLTEPHTIVTRGIAPPTPVSIITPVTPTGINPGASLSSEAEVTPLSPNLAHRVKSPGTQAVSVSTAAPVQYLLPQSSPATDNSSVRASFRNYPTPISANDISLGSKLSTNSPTLSERRPPLDSASDSSPSRMAHVKPEPEFVIAAPHVDPPPRPSIIHSARSILRSADAIASRSLGGGSAGLRPFTANRRDLVDGGRRGERLVDRAAARVTTSPGGATALDTEEAKVHHRSKPPNLDIDSVVDQVYQKLVRRLTSEQLRKGF
jgi:hypothetical protein